MCSSDWPIFCTGRNVTGRSAGSSVAHAREIGFGDDSVDAERQMRPVLLDRRHRQHRDPAPRRRRRRNPARSFPSSRALAASSGLVIRTAARVILRVSRRGRLRIVALPIAEDVTRCRCCQRLSRLPVSCRPACRCRRTPRRAQTLDKVSFGTNWVAEAEHGGFYQAVADGTYRKYGLDVTIVPGGPNVNNRILLPVGKLDFFMSANSLQSFDAVEQNIPTIAVAAMFQKDPQVLIAHPGPGHQEIRGPEEAARCSSRRRAWRPISSGSRPTTASTRAR